MELRTIRQARGWTLADLAIATGLSASYLSRVERGTRLLSTEARVRVARALRLTVTEAEQVYEIGGEARVVPFAGPGPGTTVSVEEVREALAVIGIDLITGGEAA